MSWIVYLLFLNRTLRFSAQFLGDLSSRGWVTLGYELAVSADRIFHVLMRLKIVQFIAENISKSHVIRTGINLVIVILSFCE